MKRTHTTLALLFELITVVIGFLGIFTIQFDWTYIYGTGGGSGWWFGWSLWNENIIPSIKTVLYFSVAILGLFLVLCNSILILFNKLREHSLVGISISGTAIYGIAFLLHFINFSTLNNPTNWFRFKFGFYFSLATLSLLICTVLLLIWQQKSLRREVDKIKNQEWKENVTKKAKRGDI